MKLQMALQNPTTSGGKQKLPFLNWRICVEITGKSGEVEVENSGGYPGDSQSRSASFGVYEKEIEWNPKTSLREGLSLIWEELNGD